MVLRKKFRRTTLIGVIRFVSLRISSIVYLMIMARWLSKNEMGIIVSLGIGVVLIPKSVVDWLGWVMQQKSLTTGNENFSKNIISEISYDILLFGFTFCPILAILYLFLMNIHFPSTLGFLFLFIVSVNVLVRLFLNVERSQLNLEISVLTYLLQALINYVLAVVLYFFFNSIEVILITWALTEVLACILLLYRNYNIFRGRIKIMGLQSVFKFGIPVFILFLFRSLSVTIDRIVIGAFIDQETLATYHLAYRIVDVFAQGVLILTIAIFPIIMKLESLNTEKSNLVFIGTLKVILLMILSIFPFLIMFPRFVITITLSEKYMAGASLLSVFSIGATLDIISNLNVQFKGAKGETKVMLNYALCYFLSQILAYLILLRFGAMGIAISRVLGSAISLSYIMGSASWIREISRIFFGKVIFLTTSIILALWILSQYLHVIIALVISIVVLLFESSIVRYFTKYELDVIERGIPSEAQPFFLLYRQIEGILFIGESKMD